MTLSLYDTTIPSFLQTLTALGGYLDKGLAHCTSQGVDPGTFVEARLYPDMLPLRFQVVSAAHHSLGAIEAPQSGSFSPPKGGEYDYPGLQKLVADTITALKGKTPEAIDGCLGREVSFKMRDRANGFTAENFLLSFSFPNFYFHSSIAYALLRSKGVPLGKRDFLGHLRIKT